MSSGVISFFRGAGVLGTTNFCQYSLVVIPLIGITGGIALIASLNLALGAAVLLANPLVRSRLKQVVLAGIAVVVVVSSLTIPAGKPLALYSPVFGDVKYGGEVLFYKEGQSSLANDTASNTRVTKRQNVT